MPTGLPTSPPSYQRVLALDYGTVRCGLAWTDALGLTAQPLPALRTSLLWGRLEQLIKEGPVGTLLLGYPLKDDGTPTDATPHVEAFAEQFHKRYPKLTLVLWDEADTSRRAKQALHQAGHKRKQRADKLALNSIAATMLLQDYLSTAER